ncbi:MAG: hypothetical protein RR472_07670, partial [Anaerovoracaceae bacterium]
RSLYDAPEIDNNVLFTAQGNPQVGSIIQVEITDALDYDLIGEER